MYKKVRKQDRVGSVLILPESMSESLCFCKCTGQQHRDCDMDSGSMSTLLTLSCLLTYLYNPYMPPQNLWGFIITKYSCMIFLLVAIYPSFTLYKIKRIVRESMNLCKGSSSNNSEFIARYCCGSGSKISCI